MADSLVILNLIKTLLLEDIQLVPGTRVLYDGSTWEAISQDTGKQGWNWRVVSGKNSNTNKDFHLFTYDSPIYKASRDNSKIDLFKRQEATKKVALLGKEEIVKIPDEIQTPLDAFNYVKQHKEFTAANYLIARDPYLSYLYAREILFNKRFYLDEPAIETQPKAAVRYAINILHQRWPEAENAIKKDKFEWEIYKRRFNFED